MVVRRPARVLGTTHPYCRRRPRQLPEEERAEGGFYSGPVEMILHLLNDGVAHAQEDGGEGGVELFAAADVDLLEGDVRRHALAVRAVGGHGIEGVGDA